MSRYLQWVEHKGQRVLYVNFAGIQDEAEYLLAFDEMEQEILRQRTDVKFATVIDVTDTILTPAVTDRSRELMAAGKEAGIPDSPTAMVGMTGIQKAVVQALQFFRRDLYVAESLEEGLDWAAEQLAE